MPAGTPPTRWITLALAVAVTLALLGAAMVQGRQLESARAERRDLERELEAARARLARAGPLAAELESSRALRRALEGAAGRSAWADRLHRLAILVAGTESWLEELDVEDTPDGAPRLSALGFLPPDPTDGIETIVDGLRADEAFGDRLDSIEIVPVEGCTPLRPDAPEGAEAFQLVCVFSRTGPEHTR